MIKIMNCVISIVIRLSYFQMYPRLIAIGSSLLLDDSFNWGPT